MAGYEPMIVPLDTDFHQTHHDNFQMLYQAFQNGRLPPAWLFIGPPGAGKSAFAYQFAQKILCHAAADAESLQIQHQMASGYYPNFFRLKKNADDAELGIDEIRKLIHYLRQSAPLPGWRVVIVEGIDSLNRYAANALLKTLEEPPAQTLILATAVTAARVLPTLRSRCVRLVLSSLPEEEGLLSALAQSREGGLQDLVAVGGLDFYEKIGKAVTMAVHGDFRSLLPFIEKTAQEETSFVVAVELLEQFLYRLIIHSALPRPQQFVTKEENIFAILSQDIPVEHWLTVQQALSQFLYEARATHLDKKHMLMACFIIIENPEGINA